MPPVVEAWSLNHWTAREELEPVLSALRSAGEGQGDGCQSQIPLAQGSPEQCCFSQPPTPELSLRQCAPLLVSCFSTPAHSTPSADI